MVTTLHSARLDDGLDLPQLDLIERGGEGLLQSDVLGERGLSEDADGPSGSAQTDRQVNIFINSVVHRLN